MRLPWDQVPVDKNKRESYQAAEKSQRVKTLDDAKRVKTHTTTIHNSQTHTPIFTPHGSQVCGNKEKVYYEERFNRVELQNKGCMM